MSSEFAKKIGFKLKKIERSIYIRNMNGTFNKEELIEYIVETNIHYQRHMERIEINIMDRQKWKVILGMLWLACHNSEIDQRTEKVKMTRCSEKYRKQQRPKQRKPEQQKQKKEKMRREGEKKRKIE